jgi:hypothetical protein
MNIPFGKRNLVIAIERAASRFPLESVLIDATDREIEQISRKQLRMQEPRWDMHPTLYGWHV